MTETRFRAPWGRLLTVLTTSSVVFLVGMMVLGVTTGPVGSVVYSLLMLGLPALILVGGMMFMIRGYEVQPDAVIVRRPGWCSPVKLDGLQSVAAMPHAMRGSLRTFGNGGLFCFAGWYWSRRLGHYRVFVTDLNQTVVLRFQDGRTVVVSPDDPQRFVEIVRTVRPTVAQGDGSE